MTDNPFTATILNIAAAGARQYQVRYARERLMKAQRKIGDMIGVADSLADFNLADQLRTVRQDVEYAIGQIRGIR